MHEDKGQEPFLMYGRMVYQTANFPAGTKWYFRDGRILLQTEPQPSVNGGFLPGFKMVRGGTTQSLKQWCDRQGRWVIRWAFEFEVNDLEKIRMPGVHGKYIQIREEKPDDLPTA